MSDTPRVIHRRTGNFLEDFRPGQVFRHKGGKTVTEGLFALFTEFSMTANPLSKNAHYARTYGYEGLVCPPGMTMLVAFSQTVEDVSENARANLEYIDMRFGAPVYVGDTIEVETKVLNVRPSSSRPNLGIVHVQSTAQKNIGSPDEAVVMTWQRKVQVYKLDEAAELHAGEAPPDDVACSLWLPDFDAGTDYKARAHLSSPDSYFEDFEPGTLIEHSRGRTMTDEHIHLTAMLDNTSQVHCNQHMIDLDPKRYVGGRRQFAGRHHLPDRPPHGTALRRRHGLRRHRGSRSKGPPGAPGSRHRRVPAAGAQVRTRRRRRERRRSRGLEEDPHLRVGPPDRAEAA